jgi:hypothetical protein
MLVGYPFSNSTLSQTKTKVIIGMWVFESQLRDLDCASKWRILLETRASKLWLNHNMEALNICSLKYQQNIGRNMKVSYSSNCINLLCLRSKHNVKLSIITSFKQRESSLRPKKYFLKSYFVLALFCCSLHSWKSI